MLEHALREHFGAPEHRDVTWRVLRELRGTSGESAAPARTGRQDPSRQGRARRLRALAAAAGILVAVGGALWLRGLAPAGHAPGFAPAQASRELSVFDGRGAAAPDASLPHGKVALAPADCRVELSDGTVFRASAGSVFRWSAPGPALELAAGELEVAAAGRDLVVHGPAGRLELAARSSARFQVSVPDERAPSSNLDLARRFAMTPDLQSVSPRSSLVTATLLAGTATLLCAGAVHPLEPGRPVAVDATYGPLADPSGRGDAPEGFFASEIGSWSLDVTVTEAPGAPRGAGTETVRLGPHPDSILIEMEMELGEGSRSAHVVLKWEPGRKRFTGSFADSFGGPIGVLRGAPREDGARVLEMYRPDGPSFDMRMVTEWTGDDERRTRFESKQDGSWSTSWEIVHRRSNPGAAGGFANPLFQVILEVRDVAAQAAFYRDVLGFRILEPSEEDLEGASFVRLETGGAFLALHAAAAGSPAGPSAARLSLRVASIERARERLATLGIEAGEARRPVPGVLVLDVRDPEGNLVHLEEHERPVQGTSAGSLGY